MIAAVLIAANLASAHLNLSSDLPVSYIIEARLDTAAQKIYGHEVVRFQNPTEKKIDTICFHLYPNAFADTGSVYCREDKSVRTDVASGNISRLEISGVIIDGRTIEKADVAINGTLMRIPLSNGLPPGRETQIEFNFELIIPRAKVRFGHDGNGNYLISHWYPIVCGYQKGRLVAGEYHANSEFFSDFGNYEVTLNLPSNFVLGSTGSITEGEKSDSAAIWHIRADTVIDYAFACGGNFETYETDTPGTAIHYLMSKADTALFTGINEDTKRSLALLSEKLFGYPYKNFTVVDFNSGSSGMELPGMIAITIPKSGTGRSREYLGSLVAHEVAHQWFYAAIATNEYDEPWLDEGFASFYEYRIARSLPGKESELSFLGYDLSYEESERIYILFRRPSYPIDLASYDYPSWMEYQSAVYSRANLVLQSLEIVLGDSAFASAMMRYAMKYRFKHPDTRDFEKVFSSATDMDMSTFFAQFVDGTARVDYGITGLSYKKSEGADAAANYRVTVDVRREQDGILPQIVTLSLEDGTTIDTTWDGRSRVFEFEFAADSKPVYAALDGHFTYPLDEQLSNNRLYYKSNSSRMISFDWDAAFVLEFLFSLFL